jgi:hypothetical protein
MGAPKYQPGLRLRTLLGLAIGGVLLAQLHAQPADEPPQPARPRVYALLAAIGEEFSVVSEISRTGTHLLPYQRRTSHVSDDALNRLALHSLDQAVARADPNSKRVYMALPAIAMDRVAPSERETLAIAAIKEALERMPERMQWDRIVVATPAYRALDFNGLGTKLQGFGLFGQTQCQAGCGGLRPEDSAKAIAREPPDGVDAITSEDKAIKARTFIAPFSYIAVWVLEPKTLAVLDHQEGFDSQKLAQPPEKPLDLSQADGQKYVVMRIANLIDLSVGEAVMRSEVNARRGIVEVGPLKEVKPDSEPKK